MNAQQFWTFISYFGDAQFWIGISVALLLVYPLSSKKVRCHLSWMIFALLPAILVSHEIADLIKNLAAVVRPCFGLVGCPTDYAFPSGHATVIFAFATVVSFMVKKRIYVVSAFVLAILVAASRVFLNYHYISDVIVGAIIGFLVGWFFCLTYRPIHVFLEKKGFVA